MNKNPKIQNKSEKNERENITVRIPNSIRDEFFADLSDFGGSASGFVSSILINQYSFYKHREKDRDIYMPRGVIKLFYKLAYQDENHVEEIISKINSITRNKAKRIGKENSAERLLHSLHRWFKRNHLNPRIIGPHDQQGKAEGTILICDHHLGKSFSKITSKAIKISFENLNKTCTIEEDDDENFFRILIHNLDTTKN